MNTMGLYLGSLPLPPLPPPLVIHPPPNKTLHFLHSPTLKHKKKQRFRVLATIATPPPSSSFEFELEKKKQDLLRSVQDTQRGLVTTPEQRAAIEEALVCVEGYDAGSALDLDKLDGTWRLQYTSAPDVVILFEAANRFPLLQVGQIYQKFECRNQSDRGVVRNLVRWSIPSLLEQHEGATLLVSAKFVLVSPRNINLQFQEISVQNININQDLQALIAPAILPRTYLTLQLLQFIQTFKAQVQVRQSVGGLYYLSYLDGNMLLGRAIGGGGVFIFTRAQPLQLG